jgi:hypothetical protein
MMIPLRVRRNSDQRLYQRGRPDASGTKRGLGESLDVFSVGSGKVASVDSFTLQTDQLAYGSQEEIDRAVEVVRMILEGTKPDLRCSTQCCSKIPGRST